MDIKIIIHTDINKTGGMYQVPHHRRDQMHETDVPSVRIVFGRDGIHLLEPVLFPAKYNYETIE